MKEITRKVVEHQAVENFKNWESGKLDRTYLTLHGHQSRYAGDRNTKIYVDNVRERLVIEIGKGTVSSSLYESINALKADFADNM